MVCCSCDKRCSLTLPYVWRAQHQLFRGKELLMRLAEVIGLGAGGSPAQAPAPRAARAPNPPAGAELEAGALSLEDCAALARELLVLLLECLGARPCATSGASQMWKKVTCVKIELKRLAAELPALLLKCLGVQPCANVLAALRLGVRRPRSCALLKPLLLCSSAVHFPSLLSSAPALGI